MKTVRKFLKSEFVRVMGLLSVCVLALYGVTSFIEWRLRVAAAAHPRVVKVPDQLSMPRVKYCTYSGGIYSTRGRFVHSGSTPAPEGSKVSGLP